MESWSENSKEKKGLSGRRQNVFSVFRKSKSRERNEALTSKSFSGPSKAHAADKIPASASAHERESKFKLTAQKLKSNNSEECSENLDSCSLLSLAVSEQENIMERLLATKEELRRKVKEETANRDKRSSDAADSSRGFPSEPPSGFLNFEDVYRSTLEDIFQLWIHLFYFIINLKLNVSRVLAVAGKDFQGDKQVETEVILQAIDCAKFFSSLKLNSIENSINEFWIPTENFFNETQMKNCEQQVLSPFLYEMEFIQKKAKEIVFQSQKESTLSVKTY